MTPCLILGDTGRVTHPQIGEFRVFLHVEEKLVSQQRNTFTCRDSQNLREGWRLVAGAF